jgi:atlastin
VAVLLMDTQGSFDQETTFENHAVIFAVSALLSSVLIFNVQRDLGEDTLQFLQYFTNYAGSVERKLYI